MEIKQLHVTFLFSGTAQREGMPFVLGNGRNVNKNIVAWTKEEMRRSLDD